VTYLQETLTQIQLRLQVVHRRKLTHKDLARLANTSERAVAEWMRGASSPLAMTALLHLLSQLASKDAEEVLGRWRQKAHVDSAANAAAAPAPQ